ncbi:hypothetical protein F0562_025003 [Nyssa sinensis]|uniref:Replication factor-A protein 1 N-terminal domain-containing protein n=1 Tax=Nyssa sinensis TaxID=561372 RepID=A0A5J5BFJ3_9ASTE|nr:hypothetical protein F0562_025003 [Nyssa sinensis]
MVKSVTPDAISIILSHPSPDSSTEIPEIVVQVVDLKPAGNTYMFMASDGKMKVKTILQSNLSSEVISGNIQNLGLICILDYTLNDSPTKNEKYLIVTKCETVSPALEAEIKTEVKSEETDPILKPKQEMVIKTEVDGPGIKSPHRLAAFIVCWLARYVLPMPLEDGINSRVFPLAVKLSQGYNFALGPLFLRSLYWRLDMYHDDTVWILRNDNSLRLPSPKKGEDRNRGGCGQNVFFTEKKFVIEGHNAKIEDEIFETSISSLSDNLDKVDEALLAVVTKEDEVSLLAEFSTPTIRHGKGKELKRIKKSSETTYDESSFHSLSGRSSNYDSKDDATNRESEGFPIKKRKAELLYESHKKIKLSSPVSTSNPGKPLDSTTEIVKDDGNVKQSAFGDDEKKTEFLSNSLSTGVGVEGGKGDMSKPVQLCPAECVVWEKKLSIDAKNIGVDIKGVGIDVVDIEKVGVDVEKVGGDDVGVEMVGVDIEKVGGDDVGVEMVGVDFEKVGGDYVGGETVGGDYVGGETVRVDVEKPNKVRNLFLSKTRVYSRRPLTVVEGMLSSQAGVGGEGLKASEIIPNVEDINTLQNTVRSTKIREIVQNDGTVKPSEAIPSTSAANLVGVTVTTETLPSRGGISIPNVPTNSHRPISWRYNRVLWFGDMVGEKYVPFLNLVRDRYPQTFENFKCKLSELRSVMLAILSRTIKQLDEQAIMSFQISEIHELLCAIADFKLNGLQVEWLERHLTSLLPCGFYSTFLQQKMKIRQKIVRTRARLSALEAEE